MEQTIIKTEKTKNTTIPVSQKPQGLTSSEIADIWISYMNYSMLRCAAISFLNNVDDTDVLSILEESAAICETRIKAASEFLNIEGHPLPKGFDDKDLNLNAPRLFSDIFYLYYLKNLMRIGLNVISMDLTMATRSDIREFYTECIISTAKFWNRIANTLLAKGLFVRPPNVTIAKDVDFVKKQSFLGSLFGDQRPLLAKEIEQLSYNMLANMLGKYLLSGFHQVAESKQVRAFMNRGMEISRNHAEIFGAILRKEDIPSPMAWDYMVTDSTIPPFSDKYMMFHTVTLNAAGLANYAISMASSPRRDLSLNYTRMMAEVASYADDGANIMISNGWLEEPPRVVDREELINKMH